MSLIMEYAEVLQALGVGSTEAAQFRKAHSSDKRFLSRAKTLEKCFLNRDWILGTEGQIDAQARSASNENSND